MPQIIIDDSELIGVIKKPVGTNGQISVGKEHAFKLVTAYIVLSQGSETSACKERMQERKKEEK